MLSFLMDQRDYNPIDLVPIFDSETAVEEAISGRAHIDRATADRLAELFHVEASLF
jgi:antitoxin component HigA of HigAB toxin-antitoxin module